MEMNDYSYDEIEKGMRFEFKRVMTAKDLDDFSRLTEDRNPLHCDEEYAKSTPFNGRVVHGMLVASLFSTLVGMVCPGKRNLYLKQEINFKKPVYPGTELTVRGTVKEKIDSIRLLVIETEIIADGSVLINGEAKVKLLGD